MGRIAELFEKKALSTLTEAEKKELESLLLEAKAAEGDEGDGDPAPADPAEGEDLTKEIDAAAQKMADIFQEKIDASISKNNAEIKGILEEMKSAGAPVSSGDLNAKYFVNKELGEKSVKELT